MTFLDVIHRSAMVWQIDHSHQPTAYYAWVFGISEFGIVRVPVIRLTYDSSFGWSWHHTGIGAAVTPDRGSSPSFITALYDAEKAMGLR